MTLSLERETDPAVRKPARAAGGPQGPDVRKGAAPRGEVGLREGPPGVAPSGGSTGLDGLPGRRLRLWATGSWTDREVGPVREDPERARASARAFSGFPFAPATCFASPVLIRFVVMSYPEHLLTEDEQVIREFRPHWRLLLIPVLWFLAGLVVVIAELTLVDLDPIVDLIVAGLVVVALVPLFFAPLVRWFFTIYVLTSERLITRSGVIARRGIEIPLESISNVLFHQNVLERILRSGDLLIESAGESGQSKFDDVPYPDEFQSLLYKVREQRARALAREDRPEDGVAADPTERLERLARLHREGVLTDDEFAAKKQALLDEM